MGRSLAGIEREGTPFLVLPVTNLAAFVIWAAFAVPMCAADFNQDRLQEGRIAFQQKRFGEAIDQFRVAAFGSLDQPVLLTECLARLALAQASADKAADADETLNRFVEVERQFGGFGKANLEPELRSSFQLLLTRRIPPGVLAGVPSLSELSEPPPSHGARPPTGSKAARASAPPSPTKVPNEVASPSRGERSRQALAESRRLISASRSADAERILTQALAADPENRELRLSLLEASCLNRTYGTAIAQLPAVTPFAEEEAPSMFYAAVSLYEVGRRSEARDLMQRVGSRVSGPLVDEYAKKIMGNP